MTASAAIRVILDADHGIDDTMATFYLASQSNVEIVAVGTVHGNAHADQAARNALQVLELVGLPDVPVAVGAATPLAQVVDIAAMVHGDDGLGGEARVVDREPSKESAVEQLVRLARSLPGELEILATGPLTNLALALLVEPRLPELIKRVVIMGGTIGVPGNTSPNTEANIWHDPEAAALVFARMTNLVLVPLDVTKTNWVDEDALGTIARAPANAPNDFLRKILVQYEAFNRGESGRAGFPLHDPTAAILMVKPQLAKYIQTPLDVELRGEHTRGMVIADRRAGAASANGQHSVKVAMSMNRDDVVAEFLHGVLRYP